MDTQPRLEISKTCRQCGEWKKLDAYCRHGSSVDGYRTICRLCQILNANPLAPDHKRCRQCTLVWPIHRFQHDRSALDGYRNYCKPCSESRLKRPKKKRDKKTAPIVLSAADFTSINKDLSLRYHYDPNRYYLGLLCRHNHAHDAITKSLRYITSRDCVKCVRARYKHFVQSHTTKNSSPPLKKKPRKPRTGGGASYNRQRRQTFNSLLAQQNNTCAICATSATDQKMVIDHCHTTNLDRGVLCNRCNLGLGHFKDDTVYLTRAILYLLKHHTPGRWSDSELNDVLRGKTQLGEIQPKWWINTLYDMATSDVF